MHINPTVFREYDIRGIAGANFTDKAKEEYEKWYGPFPGVTITLAAARAIGKAFGTTLRRDGGREVVIGHEVRPFAEDLTREFIDGILSTGCNVADLGESVTPVVYFASALSEFDGGANVTGSHNAYFYNGFKLVEKGARPIFGAELQEMQKMIEREDFIEERCGTYVKRDGYAAYKEYFLKHIKFNRKFRIVIDSGNGSAGMFAPDLFRGAGCDVVELYSEPDATFPNHTPDPHMPQFMADLQKKVKDTGADIGIAFDADADRVGFVDENGRLIDPELITLAFAKDVLTRFPGKKILYTVKSSQLIEELVPQYGGVPLIHRNGHAPIKETLRLDDDIIFAGEDTAHFFFVENYFRIDDGLWAAGQLLKLVERTGKPFSELFRDIPLRVRTPELKLPCRDEEKFDIINKIQTSLGRRYPSLTLDGVRFKVGKTGWGLVRASNTAPYLTVRAEDMTKEGVLRIKKILADELEKYDAIGDRLNCSAVATLTGRLGWV
ncbi:MAG: phosphomannomutase/phosphoglucomutase [Candidatus Sungbacteria bacterium]|nr:phosphomannomutase/phosphoglucomutase [Candidatus Sungbacteria bacterium]